MLNRNFYRWAPIISSTSRSARSNGLVTFKTDRPTSPADAAELQRLPFIRPSVRLFSRHEITARVRSIDLIWRLADPASLTRPTPITSVTTYIYMRGWISRLVTSPVPRC